MKKIVFAVIFVVLSVSIVSACYIKSPMWLSNGHLQGSCSNNDRAITCDPPKGILTNWLCSGPSGSFVGQSKEEAVDKACGCN